MGNMRRMPQKREKGECGKMKKWAGIVCAIVAVLLLASAAAEEPISFPVGDFRVVLLDDGTAEIVDYMGTTQELVVPDSIEVCQLSTMGGHQISSIGYQVSSIGDNAFRDCDDLKTVIIPEGITTIGDYAFYDCNNLETIVIPESVTSIGDGAFRNCYALSITLPNSVTSIGVMPFGRRFRNQYGSYIDGYAVTVIVSPDHPTLAVIDEVLFSKEDKRLIYYPYASLKYRKNNRYSVPQGIEIIGDYAFYDCDALERVNLPDSITIIGNSAFRGCGWLAEIVMQEGITTIGDSAFSGCYYLESITIPESVTFIGADAFADCSFQLVVTVTRGSYAATYCQNNNINYTYPDANNWLFN